MNTIKHLVVALNLLLISSITYGEAKSTPTEDMVFVRIRAVGEELAASGPNEQQALKNLVEACEYTRQLNFTDEESFLYLVYNVATSPIDTLGNTYAAGVCVIALSEEASPEIVALPADSKAISFPNPQSIRKVGDISREQIKEYLKE